MDLSRTQHFVYPFQPLAGLGKQHGSAYRPVQTMGNSHKHLTRFAVSLRNKGLQCLTQRLVSGLVPLDYLPAPLVENQEVIVFKQDTGRNVSHLFIRHISINGICHIG